jgi:hypothetical protein
MEKIKYPSVYYAADSASVKAQRRYLLIAGLDLSFMILGAILTVYGFKSDTNKLYIYSASGLFLGMSLMLTIILKSKSYEQIWYQGRALAESVKTLTWRFATCSELFEVNLPINKAIQVFTGRLKELTEEFKELSRVLDAKILSQPIISDSITSYRNLPTTERRNLYIKERISNQKKWYSTKAGVNLKRYNQWFWVIIVSQFISLIGIVVLIKNPSIDWNIVGLFTTISASALSWLQLKQHQELKQAYTIAAQELNFIETSANNILTDEDLSKFVLDSENAISREHTLWLAQKRR